MNMLLRASIIWLGFFVLAFVNGALREVAIKQFIAEPWAHHLSAGTGIILFTVYLWLVWGLAWGLAWRKTLIHNNRTAILVGGYWFVLTILAETFIVSRLIGKQSWQAILQNYNLADGNLWPLVLIWVALLPIVILSLKKKER